MKKNSNVYWNALLLFDEADVFLESRSNSSDIARNAIVGVFLQELEYHKGIISLTTNRDTSPDPAILSRAVLKITYKPLIRDGSLKVGSNMLSRVVDDPLLVISEMEDFKDITNGRDIRNIIRLALIYAGDSPLGVQHINKAICLSKKQ